MAAIAGVLSLGEAPVEPHLVMGLTQSFGGRGPDGFRHWIDGPVALGHCPFQTPPEPNQEHQPLVSADGNLVLVFDGRLDNRRELLASLASGQTALRTRSDAELVLEAYRIWSRNCPKHLLGDFAFALWDKREKLLFCARDQVGARQFYYVITSNFFAFASNEEAFRGLPGVSSRPFDGLVTHFLLPEFADFEKGQSWLNDVRALMPAHSLCVKPKRVEEPRLYWKFQSAGDGRLGSDQECAEAFLHVFREAVRCRLPKIGEAAVLVSGGMDSGGIAAMMGRLLPELPGGRYHAYSAIADNVASSIESRCIQAMTRHPGIKTHWVSVPSFTGTASLADLAEVAWRDAHPVNNAILLISTLCLAAGRNGHRVILHGASGDLAQGDFPQYVAPLLRSGQWRTAWQECQFAAQNNTYLMGYSPLQIMARNAWAAYVPGRVKNQWRRIRRSWGKVKPDLSWLNPDFVEKLDLEKRLHAQFARSSEERKPGFRSAHAASIFALPGVVSGLTGCQRTASRYGVDMSDPWGDRRVLEFFLNLPLHQLVRKGWTKYLARSVFEPDLGSEVVWRRDKEHLGWMFADRLMKESGDFVEHSMHDDLNLIEGYLNIPKIQGAYQRYKSLNDPELTKFMFNIVTLTQWVKRLSSPVV